MPLVPNKHFFPLWLRIRAQCRYLWQHAKNTFIFRIFTHARCLCAVFDLVLLCVRCFTPIGSVEWLYGVIVICFQICYIHIRISCMCGIYVYKSIVSNSFIVLNRHAIFSPCTQLDYTVRFLHGISMFNKCITFRVVITCNDSYRRVWTLR